MTRRCIFGAISARRLAHSAGRRAEVCAPASGVRRTRSRQSGYAFLMALFMMLIMAAGTIILLQNLTTEGRRIREQQTVWRGEQYKRAIRLYYRKTGHFPQRLDDLVKGVPGVHFLRQAYKDPMNKADGSWRFIYVNAAGQITGSVRYATLQQMVLVDQYLGLVPGAIPLGPQNAGIGVPAASLSSLGGTALSSQVAQAVQGGQISQSQISSVLNSIPGLPAGITPAQAQQFIQNMPPDQLQSILQNLPPDQQAAANEALQNLQSQPPPDQSGQSDQNPPDPNNPQTPPNQKQYSPNPDNSQNPPNTDNQDDSQDSASVIPLPAGSSNGISSSGQPINPLLLMKPTGPVDSPVFGAFLVGVGIPTAVERKSVKLYRGAKKYNQWEFIWNPLEDAVTGGQQGASGAQGGILGGQVPATPGVSGGTNTSGFGGPSTTPQPQPQQ
jgi:hypothetical protein